MASHIRPSLLRRFIRAQKASNVSFVASGGGAPARWAVPAPIRPGQVVTFEIGRKESAQ